MLRAMTMFLVVFGAACGKGEGANPPPPTAAPTEGRLPKVAPIFVAADLAAGSQVRSMSEADVRGYMETYGNFHLLAQPGAAILGDAMDGGDSRKRARLGGSGLGDGCLRQALAQVPIAATAHSLLAQGTIDVGACFTRLLQLADVGTYTVQDRVRVVYALTCGQEDLRRFDGISVAELADSDVLPCGAAPSLDSLHLLGQLERVIEISMVSGVGDERVIEVAALRVLRSETRLGGKERVAVSRDVITRARTIGANGQEQVHGDEGLESFLRADMKGDQVNLTLNDWRGLVSIDSRSGGRRDSAAVWRMSNGQRALRSRDAR